MREMFHISVGKGKVMREVFGCVVLVSANKLSMCKLETANHPSPHSHSFLDFSKDSIF